MANLFDLNRLISFVIMGVAVAVVSIVLVHRKLDWKEIGYLSVCTAASLLILQSFLPQVIPSVHQGIGLAVGAQLVGF